MKKKKHKTIKKSFFDLSKLNYLDFLSYLPNKKNVVLDFGCGNGIFQEKFSSKKIKLIKMYDKDKRLKSHIKNKYKKNSYIKWTQTLSVNYNIVFINSAIQYLTLKNYRSLMSYFFKKKVDMIIISDIPRYPYYIEAFVSIFINLKKVFLSLKYLFKKIIIFITIKKWKIL